MSTADDDAFWLREADPGVDICDASLSVEACLGVILPEIAARAPLDRARIVEIGCGVGRLTNAIQAMHPAATVIGVDISARFLDAAAQAAGEPSPSYVLTAPPGSLRGVPGVLGCDAVYTMAVLQHIDNDRKRAYITEVGEALRPGGVLIAQFVEGTHSSRCMHDALTADVTAWCVEAGLEVQRVRHDLLFPRWTWITAVRGAA